MDIKIDGIDNVLRNLEHLNPKKWKKTMRKAMVEDHRELRTYMKSQAPKDSGRLRKSIRTKMWSTKKGKNFTINVSTGPRVYGKGRINYAHVTGSNYISSTWSKYGKKLEKGMKDVIFTVVKKANG